MKFFKKTVFILLIIAAVGSLPIFFNFFWVIRGYLDPDLVSRGMDNYRNRSSRFLIGEIRSFSPYNSHVAMKVLVERKDREAVEAIAELLKSGNSQRRADAAKALASIGDQRAIEPLLELQKKGRTSSDYLISMEALSALHYEKIYPEILQMVKDGYHVSWAIDMLENFGNNSETQVVLKNIAQNNPQEYVRTKAKNTLDRINKDVSGRQMRL
ncbi:MAG: HEAT repeat domain-containing protein [Candidatus Omnitrophica bacterium]|nr:HEAT repeat domain-containing protein [Candidatus Omnitrophota bacterium]